MSCIRVKCPFCEKMPCEGAAYNRHINTCHGAVHVLGLIENSIRQGDLQKIKEIYEDCGQLPDQYLVNLAAILGASNVLEWVYSINGDLPTEEAMMKAKDNGAYATKIFYNSIVGKRPTQRELNDMAQWGDLTILKRFLRKFSVYPNQEGVNMAASDNQQDVLHWIYSITGLLPQADAMEGLIVHDRLEVLKWAYSLGAPLPPDAQEIAKFYKANNTLNWLKEI